MARLPQDNHRHARADPPGDAFLATAMDASPDGTIVLSASHRIAFLSAEAQRITGMAAEATGQPLIAAATGTDLNWGPVAEMIDNGRSGDLVVHSDAVGPVLITLRRVPKAEGAMLILLRDLSVLDHARRMASGERHSEGFRGQVERKLRPDFARQRQISTYLNRIISRGERALLQGARVLITGESGVGKTEIARHLHSYVGNANDPFIAVNCAAIPESLFESELFGYEKGAFTGALTEGKKGLIEAADGGTLFLDEVGEIPRTLQAKLLSFLEDSVVMRIGGTKPRRVNTRIISATNRDLLAMAQEKEFRLDLYYRLAVVNMPIRPLREMPELIDHLIERLMIGINQRRAKPLRLSDDLRARLRAYDYPGNIRELANLLQQISVLGEEEDEIPQRLLTPPAPPHPVPETLPETGPIPPLRDLVADYEDRVIEAAIVRFGSKRKAAEALGVNIGTIVRKTNRKEF